MESNPGPQQWYGGLGGLEQRLKVLRAGVRRDLDDEALARVVSLNLLEDPGEVKVARKKTKRSRTTGEICRTRSVQAPGG